MTNQQSGGSVTEADAPFVPEQAEPQAPEPVEVPSEPDPLAAAAIDLARQAAEEVAQPDTVGRHLSVSVDSLGLTLHAFDCTAKGYRGWRWAVTLAHVPGSDRVTVCDTVLLPGAESIMAPDWVPWSDRLAPGDLGAGDELPFKLQDPNLVPGYTVTDEDDEDQQLFWELGLGRERVLGPEGVAAAADRWHRGPHGPTADIAIQASASCVTCAYFVPLSGAMRQHFGACANEWSPADGSVVTADFGCGAHSETDLEMPAPEPLSDHILDETVVDRMSLDAEAAPGIETGSDAFEDEAVASEDEAADVSGGGASVEDASLSDVSVEDASSGDVSSQDASHEDVSDRNGSSQDASGSEGTRSVASGRMPRDAGGTMRDVVEPETAPPVEIDVAPTVDPEPVASPEDVITVRPLDEQPEAGQEAVSAESAVPESGSAVGSETVEGGGELAPGAESPANTGVVHNEAVEAVPGGQFVQAEPESEPTPPPALGEQSSPETAETAESTEAAQGEAVEAASGYDEQSNDSAEVSVGAAVPGASVLESDGALQGEQDGDQGQPAGADVAEAAQVEVGGESSPGEGQVGAAEAGAARTEDVVGEEGAGTGAAVPEPQLRHKAIAVDSAEAAAEPGELRADIENTDLDAASQALAPGEVRIGEVPAPQEEGEQTDRQS